MAHVWRLGQLCGISSLKDFHLHMGSGDGTQISRFAQQVPLPTAILPSQARNSLFTLLQKPVRKDHTELGWLPGQLAAPSL